MQHKLEHVKCKCIVCTLCMHMVEGSQAKELAQAGRLSICDILDIVPATLVSWALLLEAQCSVGPWLAE